jgi:hypothetical protein
MDVPEGNVVSSIDFDATRMVYGNAFEAFASSVDILAGRRFNQFERFRQWLFCALKSWCATQQGYGRLWREIGYI